VAGDRGGLASREGVHPLLQETPPPSGASARSSLSVSPDGDKTAVEGSQWEAFARRLRGSTTPSSSLRSSATTADTFLLEDVSGFVSLGALASS
jgi:hypothetical protein